MIRIYTLDIAHNNMHSSLHKRCTRKKRVQKGYFSFFCSYLLSIPHSYEFFTPQFCIVSLEFIFKITKGWKLPCYCAILNTFIFNHIKSKLYALSYVACSLTQNSYELNIAQCYTIFTLSLWYRLCVLRNARKVFILFEAIVRFIERQFFPEKICNFL